MPSSILNRKVMTKGDATVSDETSEVSDEQASSEQSSTDENSKEEAQSENEEAVSEDESKSAAEPNEESFTKVNPDDLPKELQDAYKQMQADYTRKTQESAEEKKKAQLYDQLVQEQMVNQKFPKQEQKAEPETQGYLAEALGVSLDELEPAQKQQLEQLAKIVDTAVNRRVGESIKPIQDDLLTRDYRQELAEARKRYEDFDEYTQDIKSIVSQNPQMSYEQAYKIASYEQAAKKGRTEAVKNFEAKKKQSSPKTSPSAKESDEPEKGFENIFNWAKKKVNS